MPGLRKPKNHTTRKGGVPKSKNPTGRVGSVPKGKRHVISKPKRVGKAKVKNPKLHKAKYKKIF